MGGSGGKIWWEGLGTRPSGRGSGDEAGTFTHVTNINEYVTISTILLSLRQRRVSVMSVTASPPASTRASRVSTLGALTRRTTCTSTSRPLDTI